jgi:hypothetical protein
LSVDDVIASYAPCAANTSTCESRTLCLAISMSGFFSSAAYYQVLCCKHQYSSPVASSSLSPATEQQQNRAERDRN